MAGRKVTDRSFFAGGMSKDSILPKGVHVQHMASGSGDGGMGAYEDTAAAIKKQQEMNVSKMKSQSARPAYKN